MDAEGVVAFCEAREGGEEGRVECEAEGEGGALGKVRVGAGSLEEGGDFEGEGDGDVGAGRR